MKINWNKINLSENIRDIDLIEKFWTIIIKNELLKKRTHDI